MAWLHNEDADILDEISQYSELETEHDNSYKSIQPKTIQEYNARMSNNRGSVFDSTLFDNDDDGITYVALGRGRGGRNTYFKPGSSAIKQQAKGVAECEQEIKDKIREISGLGYSNIYIQAALKAKQAKMKQSICDLGQALDQKLVTTSSNSCISQTGSSSKHNLSSNRNIHSGNNEKPVTLNSFKNAFSQSSTLDEFDGKEDNVGEEVENNEHYPPLNVMLKKSRVIHLHQKNKENNCDISSSDSNRNLARRKKKNNHSNVSWMNKPNGRGENFNIDSYTEFPQL